MVRYVDYSFGSLDTCCFSLCAIVSNDTITMSGWLMIGRRDIGVTARKVRTHMNQTPFCPKSLLTPLRGPVHPGHCNYSPSNGINSLLLPIYRPWISDCIRLDRLPLGHTDLRSASAHVNGPLRSHLTHLMQVFIALLIHVVHLLSFFCCNINHLLEEYRVK